MSFLAGLFGTERPIIGLVHLRALPGDPFYPTDCAISDIIDAAETDLLALQDGGIDGVLFTNEFSVPYEKHVSPVAVGSMCTVVGALLDEIKVPFGCEAIYDGDATMDVCAATGAQFTRCVFTDAWVGDLGVVNRDVAATLRHKRALRLDSLGLFYFVTSEGESNLGGRSTEQLIDSLAFDCRPDAFVVGGSAPGRAPDLAQLSHYSQLARDIPVICGTGCNAENVSSVLSAAHGSFVGTSLKHDGRINEPIDKNRVKRLMDLARATRRTE